MFEFCRSYPDWLCRTVPDRGIYKNAKEAFLAQVGYSVGLGNFWRFPYLCHVHGGATFLIAYGVCMICVGLPVYMLELTLGQYAALGPAHLFTSMCPLLSGVGWSMVLLLFMISIYYVVIISWSLFYTGASFLAPLPWSPSAGNETLSRLPTDQFYASAKDYFIHEVLGQPRGDESPYELRPWLVLCLGVAWLVLAVCLVQGVRHTGKLFYVTVIYPYVVLLCLFGMNYEDINTESRERWITNLTCVEFPRLLKLEIWREAASQVLYSIGIGHGVIMVASHNPLTHNVVRDSFMLCFLDVFTSVLCGNVFFSLAASIPPQTIEAGISPLVFMLYPAMLSRKNSSLWSLLFFVMIFALGFDSLLLMVEACTTTFFDQFKRLRPYHPIVIICMCSVLFLLGLSMCIRNGIIVFELMNEYTAKHSLLFMTFLEIVIASYCYGYSKVLQLMKDDLKVWVPLPIHWYLKVTWSFITPVCLLFFCVISLYFEDWTGPKAGTLAFICGQVVAFAPMALVPIFALYVFCTSNKSVTELLGATDAFGTAHSREGGREAVIIGGGMPMVNLGFYRDPTDPI